jgi:hypothetical protein
VKIKRKNNILPVYIACCFGHDKAKAFYRHDIFEYQVDWFLEQDTRIHLFIYLQDEEYYYDFGSKRVHWIVTAKPDKLSHVTHAKARNYIHKLFYDSDYDWAVFADNDSILYQHNYGGSIFKHMLDNPKKWESIDCWHPIVPRNEPFNHLWKSDPGLFNNNIVFKRSGINMDGALYVLSNFKKRYGLEFYYVDNYPQGSDMRLMADMIAGGMKCYKCQSVVLKEMATSSVLPGGAENRRTRNMIEAKIRIAEVHTDKGLKIGSGKGGRPIFNARDFYKNCAYDGEVHLLK